jgi:hypothetical protein
MKNQLGFYFWAEPFEPRFHGGGIRGINVYVSICA